MGNIATYTDANGTVTYTYDAQNQLLSAVNGDTTYAYTYDTIVIPSIVDAQDAVVAIYEYDPYGNLLSTEHA